MTTSTTVRTGGALSPVAHFQAEPVLILALLNAGLAVGIGFGLDLSKVQTAAIITAATAVFGLIAAFRTRPWNVTLITTIFATGLTAVVGFGHFGHFGLVMTPATIGAVTAFVGAGLAIVLRMHVSPVAPYVAQPVVTTPVSSRGV